MSLDPHQRDTMRHTAAHVMAAAIQQLWPSAKFGVGPTTEKGFYYDVLVDTPLTTEDLTRIEEKMHSISKAKTPMQREEWAIDKAIAFMADQHQDFKVELLNLLKTKGSTAVAAETGDTGIAAEGGAALESVSFYRLGSFVDLCRGPHVESADKIGVVKLINVAGAYWRGDAKNPQLQRIYAFCFPTKDELAHALWQHEEAAKRDHRKLGRELNLFHQQEEAAGQVFWHARGWTLWRTLENFVRSRLEKADYIEVKTPQLIESSLFKASGHWDFYGDNMYKISMDDGERQFGLKPMNCPCHVQIFRQGLKSYRDLPIRMAEFGSCMRNEPTGALHGIMRVRSFTQDDAHIFCREDQIEQESLDYFKLQLGLYEDLGFARENISVKLALRPDKRAGTDELWDRAEDGLRQALRAAGMAFEEMANEGAFYGPKVEFHLIDALGRSWQCGTLQLDFVLPERLGAEYVGEDSQRYAPVMLHRAALGSLERFIGILIEHYAGAFPVWLAPLQARVISIADRHVAYAEKVKSILTAQGYRVDADGSNERMQKKIRQAQLEKIPYMLVVGDREAETESVSVRLRNGTDLGSLSLVALAERMAIECSTRKDCVVEEKKECVS